MRVTSTIPKKTLRMKKIVYFLSETREKRRRDASHEEFLSASSKQTREREKEKKTLFSSHGRVFNSDTQKRFVVALPRCVAHPHLIQHSTQLLTKLRTKKNREKGEGEKKEGEREWGK